MSSTSAEAAATTVDESNMRVRSNGASPSSGQAVTGHDTTTNYPPLRREKRKWFPWKTALWALMLFSVGLTMLLLGISELRGRQDRAIPMIVVGCLAFLPGSYAVFIIFAAWKRWPGYRYDLIPSYDQY